MLKGTLSRTFPRYWRGNRVGVGGGVEGVKRNALTHLSQVLAREQGGGGGWSGGC